MVDTKLYKLYLRHLYTLTTRLVLSCVSFNNKINLDEPTKHRANTPVIPITVVPISLRPKYN